MVRVLDDNTALKLIRTGTFENSLQRERGSQRAYIDGWRLLMGDDVEIDDINFTFEDPWGEKAVLDLKFVADNPLPHDINVLIGPNGVGKSQILQKMVAAWLDPRGSRENGRGVFSEQLNLSQMVVVSYSPFELFPVDATGHDLRDEGVYRYFGMRGRGNPRAPNPEVTSVSLNKLHSQKSAVESLIQCVRDDQRYGAIEEWSRKIPTMESVLATAIQFDFVALHVRPEGAQESLMREDPLIERDLIRVVDDDDSDMVDLYLPIARERVTALKPNAIRRNVDATKGVVFFRDGKPINLSSGQRLFSYIVINILGVLRRNSLILVDEPELFLHPTLEIQFVEMLKEILAAYGSKVLRRIDPAALARDLADRPIRRSFRPGRAAHLDDRPLGHPVQDQGAVQRGEAHMAEPSIHRLHHQGLGSVPIGTDRLDPGIGADHALARLDLERLEPVDLSAPPTAPYRLGRCRLPGFTLADPLESLAQVSGHPPRPCPFALNPASRFQMNQPSHHVGSLCLWQAL